MKRIVFLLIVLTLTVSLLASCDDLENITGGSGSGNIFQEGFCQHRDADDNNLCDNCAKTYTDGQDIIDVHTHSFSDWTNYSGNGDVPCEERLFYQTCRTCGAIEWKTGVYSMHKFTTIESITATCADKGSETKKCTLCGFIETKEIPTIRHSYATSYTSNNLFHWYECTVCADKKDEAKHTEGADGFCKHCTQALAPTEGVIYDISRDGTYAEVIGYEGAATRVSIADTYNGVPVTSIYKAVFSYKNFITTVSIPDSVTSIGDSAFCDCTSLTNVTIGNSVTSIGDSAFSHCSILTSIVIPKGVTSIGNGAFSHCSNLASIVIPDSVTSIGNGAFYWCDNLTSIVIPEGLTSIGEYVFYNCNGLTSIVIPDSVTSIGNGAFSHCSNLTSIVIPDSVTSVGRYAFSDCSSLFTEYEYGQYIGDENNPYAILYSITNKNLSTYTLHEDTKVIAYGSFRECAKLSSITSPEGVRGISSYAFRDCSSLRSVTIPDSVTSIGNYAFYGCTSLTIYCEAESQPEDWHPNWNYSRRPVIWGYVAKK